jgi:hypothetical protein
VQEDACITRIASQHAAPDPGSGYGPPTQSTLDSSLYMTWCRFSAIHSSICASVM